MQVRVWESSSFLIPSSFIHTYFSFILPHSYFLLPPFLLPHPSSLLPPSPFLVLHQSCGGPSERPLRHNGQPRKAYNGAAWWGLDRHTGGENTRENSRHLLLFFLLLLLLLLLLLFLLLVVLVLLIVVVVVGDWHG